MKMLVLREVVIAPNDQSTILYREGWRGTAPRALIERLVAAGAAVVIDEAPPEPIPAEPVVIDVAPEPIDPPADDPALPADEPA